MSHRRLFGLMFGTLALLWSLVFVGVVGATSIRLVSAQTINGTSGSFIPWASAVDCRADTMKATLGVQLEPGTTLRYGWEVPGRGWSGTVGTVSNPDPASGMRVELRPGFAPGVTAPVLYPNEVMQLRVRSENGGIYSVTRADVWADGDPDRDCSPYTAPGAGGTPTPRPTPAPTTTPSVYTQQTPPPDPLASPSASPSGSPEYCLIMNGLDPIIVPCTEDEWAAPTPSPSPTAPPADVVAETNCDYIFACDLSGTGWPAVVDTGDIVDVRVTVINGADWTGTFNVGIAAGSFSTGQNLCSVGYPSPGTFTNTCSGITITAAGSTLQPITSSQCPKGYPGHSYCKVEVWVTTVAEPTASASVSPTASPTVAPWLVPPVYPPGYLPGQATLPPQQWQPQVPATAQPTVPGVIQPPTTLPAPGQMPAGWFYPNTGLGAGSALASCAGHYPKPGQVGPVDMGTAPFPGLSVNPLDWFNWIGSNITLLPRAVMNVALSTWNLAVDFVVPCDIVGLVQAGVGVVMASGPLGFFSDAMGDVQASLDGAGGSGVPTWCVPHPEWIGGGQTCLPLAEWAADLAPARNAGSIIIWVLGVIQALRIVVGSLGVGKGSTGDAAAVTGSGASGQ